MKKNIPYIKIEKYKKQYQFYLNELPIHPDHLFPRLNELDPFILYIQVYKNDKLYWDAYYPIKENKQIDKIVWKAFRFKL